jgi:hypothetical protein
MKAVLHTLMGEGDQRQFNASLGPLTHPSALKVRAALSR